MSNRYLNAKMLNPDSAVEREVMSEEQTFHNEDKPFLPLRKRQLSVRCVTRLSTWRRPLLQKKQNEHKR
jgi:hypothetical protein